MGHTAVIRINWKLVSCIMLTANFCTIKIKNVTNVLRRKVIHVFPTSMESSEHLQKPGWKNSQQRSAKKNLILRNEDMSIRTPCIFPIPFLLAVQRGNEHPSRTALSWKPRLEHHEVSEQRDYRTKNYSCSTVVTSVRSVRPQINLYLVALDDFNSLWDTECKKTLYKLPIRFATEGNTHPVIGE